MIHFKYDGDYSKFKDFEFGIRSIQGRSSVSEDFLQVLLEISDGQTEVDVDKLEFFKKMRDRPLSRDMFGFPLEYWSDVVFYFKEKDAKKNSSDDIYAMSLIEGYKVSDDKIHIVLNKDFTGFVNVMKQSGLSYKQIVSNLEYS